MKKSDDAVMRALMQRRLDLILREPFFGSLCMRLAVKASTNHDSVAWTDGKVLGVHPERFLALPEDEQLSVVAHEVAHCAMGHPFRQGPREQKRWNEAADHAVNHMLREAGFTIPSTWLCDDQYKGKSAEVIYSLLQQQEPQQPQEQEQDEGDDGDDQEAEQEGQQEGAEGDDQGEGDDPAQSFGGGPGGVCAPSDEEQEGGDSGAQTEADWQAATEAAAMIASQQKGEGAGWMASIVGASRKPKVDWRAELARFVQRLAPTDYSWRQPSGRYMARGLYMPRLSDPQLGPVVIVRDTSASVGDAELEQFNAEIREVLEAANPERIVVMDCDWQVHKSWRIEAGEELPEAMKTAHGRGGTSFREPFAEVEKDEELQPACLIYLTDLAGDFPDAPDYPVMWVTVSDIRHAPFGEVVAIN